MTVWGAPRLPPKLVQRPGLVSVIESAAPLVIVHGPAGAGKTSLLAEWAAHTVQCGVWVQLETKDTSGPAAVSLIAAELSASAMLAETNPLRLADAALVGGTDEWSLLRRGLQSLGHDIVLVVDQADLLNAEALASLLAVLARVPRLRLVLSARRISVVDASGPVLAAERAVIGWRELMFSREEARAALGADEPEQLVDEILRWGGSPLLTRAVAASAPGASDAAARVARAVDTYESYLWANAGSGESATRDDEYRSFLLAISVADVLTESLAQELSGSDDAAALLVRAEQDGLGLWHGDTRDRVFTLTPLLRESFLHELTRADRGSLKGLRRQVALWSHRHGRPYEALEFAMHARDLTLASTIVRDSAFLLLRNHPSQVIELFSKTPMLALRQHPLLAMLLALIFNARKQHRLRAIELFGLAIASSRIQGDRADPPDRALFRTIESASLRVLGSFEASLAAAEVAYETLIVMSLEDRALLGRLVPVLFTHIGTSFFYNGRMDKAMDCFRRSASIGEAENLPAGLEGLALEAGAAAITGDLVTAADRSADGARRSWPDGWINGYAGSFYRIANAFIALERFDADTADMHVRSLDKHRPTIEHWPILAHLDALIALFRGDVDRALLDFEREVDTRLSRSALGPFTAARLKTTRSLLYLAAGDADAAEEALVVQGRRGQRDTVALARISLARGNPDETLELLERHPHGTDQTPRVEAEMLVLRAAALVATGRDEGSAATLRAARFLRHSRQALAFALIPAEHQRSMLTEMSSIEPSLGDAPSLIPLAPTRIPLTSREEAVAEQLVRFSSASDIAAALVVSPNTVKSQLRSLYRKLGVSNRADAIAAVSARRHTR
ncbi:LuxR C-terminal-related transcriptional regulator [Agreia pratensis]|uniref:LuxR family transcriptional regulator, maltose regulon positive regulatory protein n=1 Tax=Agreia pratensis TaxID=150121 RepID=A0A1X7IJ47_9MICO|nr:LuxR C-terminal-related transcriptional regulator [Agreia pratensis]SMG14736.1 LuxR family transcriptional regulator, maltose regulon positive regulatory protein [Agreia pratensis]